MSIDNTHWQQRLVELSRKHDIVGASLAIAHGDETVAEATGVLNIRTGHPVRPESVLQIGSITKVWTVTLAMQLVDEGLLDLDAPVIRYLPDFKVADPEITATVTTRQLMSHTSGIDGDLFLDTGRGDDALAGYVAAMAKLTRVIPPGKTMSYCNSGFSLLGHLVATLCGKTWEEVLRERLFNPLGLASAGTLPEEALLYGAATGHLRPPGATEFTVTPQWGIFRSAGPAGLIHCTATDQLAFARMHLKGGVTTDGTRLLSEASAKAMLVPQVEVPDCWSLGSHWGLGWILETWDGQPVYGHDGSTLGQNGYLRVLPEAQLAISLLVNGGGNASALYRELFTEVATALAGVAPKPMPKAVAGLKVDPSRYVGTYRRVGMDMIVAEQDGTLTLAIRPTSGLPGKVDQTVNLLPHSEGVLLASVEGQEAVTPVVFFDLDGKRYLHCGARTVARAEI